MPLWTIKQLVEQVTEALRRLGLDQSSGRVRSVPDVRTIRYYSTAGILDKPLSFRGRTALYGRRHLLQILAVKRLQSDGRSLGEVQASLVGLSDVELSALVGLDTSPPEPAEPTWTELPRETPFWSAQPVPVAPAPSAVSVLAVQLASGVLLVLPAGSTLSDSAMDAIALAAAPLVQQLSDLDLIQQETSND